MTAPQLANCSKPLKTPEPLNPRTPLVVYYTALSYYLSKVPVTLPQLSHGGSQQHGVGRPRVSA